VLALKMSIRVAILAILVGVISVVAEYTQPSIWPQVFRSPYLVTINHRSLTLLPWKKFLSSAQVIRDWSKSDQCSPLSVCF